VTKPREAVTVRKSVGMIAAISVIAVVVLKMNLKKKRT
jgi:hypothetical protein